MKIPLLIAALAFAGTVAAQTGEQRGSAPLGTAQDGSRPADGAIKGGTIAPGESAGMPERNRCHEMQGTLREDCLKQQQEREAAGGASPGAYRRSNAFSGTSGLSGGKLVVPALPLRTAAYGALSVASTPARRRSGVGFGTPSAIRF